MGYMLYNIVKCYYGNDLIITMNKSKKYILILYDTNLNINNKNITLFSLIQLLFLWMVNLKLKYK